MKRFKVHTITDKNCKWIFSKVRKFFEGRDGFTSWHQFYGGMQKRVSTFHNNRKFSFCHIYRKDFHEGYPFNDLREQVLHEYRNEFETCTHDEVERIPENFLVIHMNEDEGFCLSPGDQVAFLGNRILIRTKGGVDSYKYCYQVFQILKEI